jgi:hypothetical protein
MSRALRLWTMAALATLWLSGIAWIVLHYAFPAATEFGAAPNAWEPATIRIHGIIALGTVFVLGWIMARHVTESWSRRRNRASGLTLTISCLALALSGYALYYIVGDAARTAIGLTHEILGAIGIVFAVVHWLKRSTSSP